MAVNLRVPGLRCAPGMFNQLINAAADAANTREKDMKSVKFNPLTSLVMAVALTVGLAGCGGGSDTVTETVDGAGWRPMEPDGADARWLPRGT